MKITAVLVALAAAVAAPLASAACSAGQTTTFAGLSISNSIKRTTANGGGRIVQTIVVKNTGTDSATGLTLESAYNADNTLIKGYAKAPGSARVTLAKSTSGANRAISGTTITIPAGKTLKATIAYKAPNCITGSATTQAYAFGAASIGYPADSCTKSASAANSVTVTEKKSCSSS